MNRSLKLFMTRWRAFGALLLSVGPTVVVVVDMELKVRGLPGLNDSTYIIASVSGIALGVVCGSRWQTLQRNDIRHDVPQIA